MVDERQPRGSVPPGAVPPPLGGETGRTGQPPPVVPAADPPAEVGTAEPSGRGAVEAADPIAREAVERIGAHLGRIEATLEQMAEHVRLERREKEIREFTLTDLLAAIVQVVAIAAMLGAVLALLQQPTRWAAATVSLLGATALQGLALTLFMLSRRK